MATNNNVNTPLSGNTGTGNFVGANTPTLITPVLGVATATSLGFGGDLIATFNKNTSWTPVFTCATPGDLSVSYSTQIGVYTVLANQYFVRFSLVCTPTFSTASGAIRISGLPATSLNGGVGAMGGQSSGVVYTAGSTYIIPQVIAGQTYFQFQGFGSASGSGALAIATVVSGVAVTLSGFVQFYTTAS